MAEVHRRQRRVDDSFPAEDVSGCRVLSASALHCLSLLSLWAVDKKDHYSLEEVFNINSSWAGYKAQWHKIWTEHKLDVILCPGAENTAVLHDTYGIPVYTAVWNLLECPGVIIPVGKADKSIDKDELADQNMKRPCKSRCDPSQSTLY